MSTFCSFVGGFSFFIIFLLSLFLGGLFSGGLSVVFCWWLIFLLLFSAAVDILLLLILLSSSHSVTHSPPCSIIALQKSAQPTAPPHLTGLLQTRTSLLYSCTSCQHLQTCFLSVNRLYPIFIKRLS